MSGRGGRGGGTGRAARAVALLLGVGALAVFLAESAVRHAQLDDAYISYRYGRNLVEGNGLVYNPGEAVEGITNLLWTLMVALGIALGFKANATGHVLGLVSGVAAVLATWWYARRGLPPPRAWIAAVAAWVLVSSLPFALWATSGMETALFTAATLVALAAHARGRVGGATLAAAVATLTRPDGVLVAATIYAFHLVENGREGWRAWRWPAVYTLLGLVLVGFRLAYYGSPVPNTFFAKVGGIPVTQGLAYLGDFFAAGPFLLLIPAAIALVRDRLGWPGGVFCAITCVYTVAVGGDVFPHGRFLLPVLACLSALAVQGASQAWSRDRYAGILVAALIPGAIAWQVFGGLPWWMAVGLVFAAAAWALGVARNRPALPITAAAIGAGLAILALTIPGTGARDALRNSKRSLQLREVRTGFGMLERMGFMRARRLEERGEPVRLVAGGAIGAFGYFSNLPIVDLYGLVDPEIARSRPAGSTGGASLPGHQRSNAELILSREPDYILIPDPDSPISEMIPANLEITAHPDLEAFYEWDEEVWGYRRRRPPHPVPPR